MTAEETAEHAADARKNEGDCFLILIIFGYACAAMAESRRMETIRYLEQKEKCRTRPLYEGAFSEDSEEFVNYYYQWKTADNRILVMEEEDRIQVMLHLNPYSLWCYGRLRNIPYIVAVATEPDCRRQGKMRRVMEFALRDLERGKVPFAFLLPADPAYYQGQVFVFFNESFSKDNRMESEELQAAEALPSVDGLLQAAELPQTGNERLQAAELPQTGNERLQEAEPLQTGNENKLQWRQAGMEDIPELAEFSNHILREQYHIFIRREEQYYKRLFLELKTEQGGILLGRQAGRLKGALVYGMEQPGRAEVRELLLEPGICRRGTAKTRWVHNASELLEPGICRRGTAGLADICKAALPDCEINAAEFAVMFRIASLKEFVSLIKSETRRCYEIEVRDAVIAPNCGCYRIELGEDGGRMQEIPREKVKQAMDISSLARLLVSDARVHLREWV